MFAKKVSVRWGRDPEEVLVRIFRIDQGEVVPVCAYRGDVDVDVWSHLDDTDADELSVPEKSRLLQMVHKIKGIL